MRIEYYFYKLNDGVWGAMVKDGYWTGSTGPLVHDDGSLDHGTLEYALQFSLDRPPSPVQWTISILC